MLLKVVKNTVLFSIIIGICLLTSSCGHRVTHDTGNAKDNELVIEDTLAETIAVLNTTLTSVQNDTLGPSNSPSTIEAKKEIIVGANRTKLYLPLLKGKRVGVVANQTSVIFDEGKPKTKNSSYTHLIDSLMQLKVNIKKVFAPEHGFRGTADAGELVKDGKDTKTGLLIHSLHGKYKKPTKTQLENVDIMIFDIQDVGVRFYTYISTLHNVMEACAEQGVKLMILDRPNPNGHYVDGPILKEDFSSFVGMHEVPVVHGMTVGEYAQMINGEKWLAGGIECSMRIIPCEGWDHSLYYELPIAPSPNLPDMASVYLYPSLCFFEGTVVSIGRGTDTPFQLIGHPDYKIDSMGVDFSFTPQPNGGSKHPKLEGENCFGIDLSTIDLAEFRSQGQLELSYLFDFYQNLDQG
ncbi:MAG: exo-beta-N-acetylmuramidase NamZ domain-containing protein, partial [Winogradskyella sp.]|uniref:exo-beta-N-acetylmuramidase NamZ family protein n=1 Tax=Winogradskyella sp. TaxID=1883156 RepID=UPI003858A74A